MVSHEGFGIGRTMTKSAMISSYQRNAAFMTLRKLNFSFKVNDEDVSVENLAAQKLYQSLGFSPSRWISEYYADEEEDGILMKLDLQSLQHYTTKDIYCK